MKEKIAETKSRVKHVSHLNWLFNYVFRFWMKLFQAMRRKRTRARLWLYISKKLNRKEPQRLRHKKRYQLTPALVDLLLKTKCPRKMSYVTGQNNKNYLTRSVSPRSFKPLGEMAQNFYPNITSPAWMRQGWFSPSSLMAPTWIMYLSVGFGQDSRSHRATKNEGFSSLSLKETLPRSSKPVLNCWEQRSKNLTNRSLAAELHHGRYLNAKLSNTNKSAVSRSASALTIR
jgi:hypothetical protein